jgi:polysaccharide pyruvyl transferase WcaK-like protein
MRKQARRIEPSAATPRVGLFGLLGCGNIGNDASMDAVMRYLRADHAGAIIEAMCTGPETLRDQYGIAAIPLRWSLDYEAHIYRRIAVLLKLLGRCIDIFRTAKWVRRQDVVIVPGAGVLETTLPTRPWKMPYALFLLAASGRVFGTKVALVSVGASPARGWLTRRLFRSAAHLAFYRSYRDSPSREVMRLQGVDVTEDSISPDLAFSLPAPSDEPGDSRIVCVGVMEYIGSADDRMDGERIYASYIEAVKSFVRWLIDDGRKVRLVIGDTNNSDEKALKDVLSDVQAYRPTIEPDQVTAEPVTSFAELMQAMAPAGLVVATRFHNVICALKLNKPTIALGYSSKFATLMADMGLQDFCQSAKGVDGSQLIVQFKELEQRQAEVREMLKVRNSTYERLLRDQFARLSETAFWPEPSVRSSATSDTRVGETL